MATRSISIHIVPSIVAALTLGACAGDPSPNAEGGASGSAGSGETSVTASGGDSAGTSGSASASDGDDDEDDDGDDASPKFDVPGATGPSGDPEDMPAPDMGPPVCDEQNPVTLYLSPDDSNSMSAPVQARAAVLGGWNDLSAVPIRVWEFFNYYSFDYPPAAAGELELSVELLRPDAAMPGEFVLQIAVSSEEIFEVQPPINLTLVLDASGSMAGQPMELLKESCRAIAASLSPGDVVSIVTWDTSNAVVLAGHSVQGPNDPTLLDVIDAIEAGGGTDLNGGLNAGYDLAEEYYDAARLNRVVLISDGGANAGVTDIEIIAGGAADQDAEGIYLVGVGVGTATTYHDALIDAVTDAGKGASVFVPDSDEAWKVLHDDFVNTMLVAARNVQVRVDLPAGFKFVTFSGEEMSGDPAEIEPQHVAPNDAVVFHQRISSCAPNLLGPDSQLTVTATYEDAVAFAPNEVSTTVLFDDLLQLEAPQLLKGAAVFAYAEALKAWKAGDSASIADAIADALAAVTIADAFLPGDADLAEIREVLEGLE